VALTYHIFENAVHSSITRIWYTWLNTNSHRLLIIPTAIVLGLLYFGLQHILDAKAEKHQAEGLGEGTPKLSVANYAKVLFLGFFSLIAGASLGPEAILVPACMILGGYVGLKLFKGNKEVVQLLTAAGLIALFAAFFDSFIVGMLAIFLVTSRAKIKPNLLIVIVAILVSVSTLITLKLVSGKAYVKLPPYSWHINIETILLMVVVLVIGYGSIILMSSFKTLAGHVALSIKAKDWWIKAFVAAIGISILYLLGGHLVEFTGNLSIAPMFQQASSLGVIGLLWILLIKVAAIAWSKTLGYRGGLIFPSIFVASIIVAIAQQYVHSFNLIYGILAILAGMIIANRKYKVLF
jgi:H+/Cl- antiporter ClcA